MTSSRKARHKVQIIGHEPDACLLLVGLLAREGFYVSLECELDAAQREVEQDEPPQAIVVDEQGFSNEAVKRFVKSVRAASAWNNVKVFVLSNNSSEEQEVEFLEMGADDYMVKPLRTKALTTRLKLRLKNV